MDASWITLNIYTLSTASISILEPVFLSISRLWRIDRFDDLLSCSFSDIFFSIINDFDNHFEILLINFNFSFISIFLFIYWIYFSFPLPSFLIKRASDYCDQSKFIWFQFYWMKFELFFFNIIKSIFSLDFFFFLSTNILIKDNIRHANDTFHGHVVHVTRY